MKLLYSDEQGAKDREDELSARIAKLEKINQSLMNRVERSMAQQRDTFSLFHTAIGLESQVRVRTEALNSALANLERSNDELVDARDASDRANQIKTRFFTAVGHDLLQPLHAARLSVSALEATTTPAAFARLTQQIDNALSTIEDLLKTILDLSKLEAGVLKPEFEAVELDELFQSLSLEVEPIAESTGLKIAHRPTDLVVSSDPLMLRRVLQNLLVNALRYTGSGSVLLAARRRSGRARIEVWDTGPGIPVNDRIRIFEEFQRGSALASSGGGFGLGLAIVKRMADALDHEVNLCSREGCGTCFSIYAPVTAKVDKRPELKTSALPPAVSPYGFDNVSVLVIDNDEIVVEAMRVLLESWGCRVRTANTNAAIEAISADTGFRPDIVLADFHLDQGTRGTEVIGRLRRLWERDVPAVVITADHSSQTASDVLGSNSELLRKPVKPPELRALMSYALRR